MDKLFLLLHELIEHAVPAGNKRGELHALADELTAEALAGVQGTAAKVPAAVKAPVTQAAVPPLPPIAFTSPAVPGGLAKP